MIAVIAVEDETTALSAVLFPMIAAIAVWDAATADMAADDDTTALSAVLFAMIAAIAVWDEATAVIAVEDDAIAAIAVEDAATALISSYALQDRPASVATVLPIATPLADSARHSSS